MSAENANKKLSDYIRFIIDGNRIIKENDKYYLIKYSNNQNFWYPKALVHKQQIDLTGEYLFTTLAPNKSNCQYLQLSFKAKSEPYLDKDGNHQIKDYVEISSKLHGELDEFGNQKYNKSKMSLWDLKKHFAEETKQLIATAKEQQTKNSNATENKAQVLTLN